MNKMFKNAHTRGSLRCWFGMNRFARCMSLRGGSIAAAGPFHHDQEAWTPQRLAASAFYSIFALPEPPLAEKVNAAPSFRCGVLVFHP